MFLNSRFLLSGKPSRYSTRHRPRRSTPIRVEPLESRHLLTVSFADFAIPTSNSTPTGISL